MGVKKIITCADIHIRNLRRQTEYQEILSEFINECREICDKYEEGEVRIVICGDLFHNKLDISGEGYVLGTWFLRELDNIAQTYVIAGNHDINMANLSRMDPLSTIFGIADFKRTYYIDKLLEYNSGCFVDDNIVWCLYSSFDNFTRPNIDESKLENPEKTFVGLYHGIVQGSKTDVGYEAVGGFETSYFDGLDVCLCGHIHKRQTLTYNGTKIIYPGSMIQQDHGENISSHGYIVWDVDEETCEEVDIKNEEYGFYTFTINSINDIDENKEEIINL